MANRNSDLLEQFFNGQLNPDEEKLFFESIAKDDDLKAEYDAYLQTLRLVNYVGRKQIKSKLSSIGIEIDNKRIVKRKIIFVALSIILVGLAFLWLRQKFINNRLNNIESLIISDSLDINEADSINEMKNQKTDTLHLEKSKNDAEKTNPSDLSIIFMPFRDPSLDPGIRGGVPDDPVSEFMQSYWLEDYKQAIQNYSQIPDNQKRNLNLQFQYANSLAALNRLEEARIIFHKIAGNQDARYNLASEYYEAIMLIKLNRPTQAKAIFTRIVANSDHPFYEQSKKMLQKIK